MRAPAPLQRHPDRLFPSEPGVRAIARRVHEAVRELPILSPHGHVDPRIVADDVPFTGPARCSSLPTTTSPACCTPTGCRRTTSASAAVSGRRTGHRRPGGCSASWHLFRGTPSRYWLESELAGSSRPSGAIDDTRAFCSIPARHDMARRLDAGHLARLVAEHPLEEDEAVETAVDLVAGRPREVFEL